MREWKKNSIYIKLTQILTYKKLKNKMYITFNSFSIVWATAAPQKCVLYCLDDAIVSLKILKQQELHKKLSQPLRPEIEANISIWNILNTQKKLAALVVWFPIYFCSGGQITHKFIR